MLEVKKTAIPGCFEMNAPVHPDQRGRFVKTFHSDTFCRLGMATDFREQFYTVSHRGVLRGLHYQRPPSDLHKLVYCTDGEVFDVVLDLRRGSPSYGEHLTFLLSADKGNQIYIPKGLAHGFYVTSASATVVYAVTAVYSEAHDTGILWSSAGIAWPDDSPAVSGRDANLPHLSETDSPFQFDASA